MPDQPRFYIKTVKIKDKDGFYFIASRPQANVFYIPSSGRIIAYDRIAPLADIDPRLEEIIENVPLISDDLSDYIAFRKNNTRPEVARAELDRLMTPEQEQAMIAFINRGRLQESHMPVYIDGYYQAADSGKFLKPGEEIQAPFSLRAFFKKAGAAFLARIGIGLPWRADPRAPGSKKDPDVP